MNIFEKLDYQIDELKRTSEDVGRCKFQTTELDDLIYTKAMNDEDYSDEAQELSYSRLQLDTVEQLQNNIIEDINNIIEELKYAQKKS
ncbi:hypothetical protein [Lactobacillus terrae]|uniref:hypothetical protein n=1 Tax=Lactobacillus terrae TaxID=2269374 RepID=UPI000C1B7824|nr:hypothetical protein [Lactobacillus terrae]